MTTNTIPDQTATEPFDMARMQELVLDLGEEVVRLAVELAHLKRAARDTARAALLLNDAGEDQPPDGPRLRVIDGGQS